MTFRFRHFALCAPAIFLLALSGCGNSPYPPGQTAQPILYTAISDDPRTLDPGRSYRNDEAVVLDVIHPSYYQYHYLKRDPFQLQLMLGAKEATRAPYAFIDPKTRKRVTTGEIWTLQVRSDLKFQDDACFPGGRGRAITARDFAFAMRRMGDPSVQSPVLGFLGDKILGMPALLERNSKLQKQGKPADYTTPLEGLQLDPKNPYVFRVALNQPYPQMRYLLAMHFTSPVAYEAVAKYGKDLGHHPVGCGPYLIEEWSPKRRIVLKKNPNRPREFYPAEGAPGDLEAGRLKFAGQQLPLNDKIVFSNIKEGVTAWNLFLQGYMDSASVSNSNYSQTVNKQGGLSDEMRARGVRLTKSDEVGVSYVVINMKDPVVGGYTPQKRKLRQALSLALNTQEFIDLFSQGLGKRAQSVIPPGIFGYDANYQNPYRQYDPKLTRAKQLLQEAGYPNGRDAKSGERLTLFYDYVEQGALQRQTTALLKRQIEKLGVKLQTRASRDVVWQDRVDKGQFQLVRYGWLADYPDAENFTFLLYGPNKRPGPNVSAYDNPAYNTLFEQMRSMDDGPKRLALIKRMLLILQEDAPLIWDENGEGLSLAYNWVQPAARPHPVARDIYKYRHIDAQERAQKQRQWNSPRLWPLLAIGSLLVLMTLPAASVVKNRRNRRVTKMSDQ